jgi:hypothetical protein
MHVQKTLVERRSPLNDSVTSWLQRVYISGSLHYVIMYNNVHTRPLLNHRTIFWTVCQTRRAHHRPRRET